MHCNARTETIADDTAAARAGKPGRGRRITSIAAAGLMLGLGAIWMPAPAEAGYVVTNLVSDLPGVAPVTDLDLVNPWGLTRSDTSPWWVADNGTGLSTLYNGLGVKQGLVVTIPPAGGGAPPSAPTGVVFNSDNSIPGSPRFIFSTENGVIASWAGTAFDGTNAIRRVDNSAAGAIYKGLAISTAAGQDVVYATDFHNGRIDAYRFDPATSAFTPANLTGKFVDPNLPSGYAPFGIQNIDGKLYVTYAKQGTGGDDEPGPGNGIVDVFKIDGTLDRRFATGNPLNIPLNSPWGIALAPGDFGQFSNDLLIGNFGDGTISAFDLTTSKFLGQLQVQIDGLWALQFGSGNPNLNSGAANHLYLTAGIPGPDEIEDHGLFGFIAATTATAVPEPASAVLLLSALGFFGFGRLPLRRR